MIFEKHFYKFTNSYICEMLEMNEKIRTIWDGCQGSQTLITLPNFKAVAIVNENTYGQMYLVGKEV